MGSAARGLGRITITRLCLEMFNAFIIIITITILHLLLLQVQWIIF